LDEHRGYATLANAPRGCQGASYEVLTATIGQLPSILQCLDRPIENASGVVKNWG